jgi:ADP-ribosylglycohydrolase
MNASERARASLEGLATGDAFGETFFHDRGSNAALDRIGRREVPPGPWRWTDDTAMAIDVVLSLEADGRIDQEALARRFGQSYRNDPYRGYGPAMHSLLERYADGYEWLLLASGLFNGTGSFGNGAAMRVAPVGAYFADNLDAAAEAAVASAIVTHTHAEAEAGATAVAIAAALAACRPELRGADYLESIIERVPSSDVREGIARAIGLGPDRSGEEAAMQLGNGSDISCQDTVPFTLWCAAFNLDDYEEALWVTVAGLGDRDTTCAIVGGILGARVGVEGIPEGWLRRREPLDPVSA